jgi:hypothetical protein
MRVVLSLALTLILFGCGLPPSVFRSDHSNPLLEAPPLGEVAGGGVWIAPIAGATAKTETFRRALAKALLKREVPVGLDSAGPRGARLLAVAAPATYEGRGYVDIWWRLEGADGALWDAFVIATPLDYRIERPETQVAVAEIADRLGDMLGPPPPAKAAVVERIMVAIPIAETTGFEDGKPLARAMAAALGARGFQPSPLEGAKAIVKITAKVEPTAAQKNSVFVTIRWAVETLDGKEVGAAEQKNILPDTAVGDGLEAIAGDAAGAAAQSITGLIRLAVKNVESSTAKGAS